LSKLSEPQSKALAKLCVYAILSTIEAVEMTPQKKRPRPDDDDSSPMSKMRKTGSDQSVEGSVSEKELNSQQLKENLKSILQDLFKVFHQQVVNDELSPKVNFIFQFFSLLVQYEKSTKIKNILKLIPNGLIMNIIKLIPYEDLTFGFLLR
jgi:mediator of RNA polymerase II transcription subunit 24